MEIESSDTIAKVPAVTFGFWIIKIIATTLGETGGDAVSMTLNWGYALSSALFIGIFVAAVVAQIGGEAVPSVPVLGGDRRNDHRGNDDGGFRRPFARHWLFRRRADPVRLPDGCLLGIWYRQAGSISWKRSLRPGSRCSTGSRSCSRKRSGRRWATGWPIPMGSAMSVGLSSSRWDWSRSQQRFSDEYLPNGAVLECLHLDASARRHRRRFPRQAGRKRRPGVRTLLCVGATRGCHHRIDRVPAATGRTTSGCYAQRLINPRRAPMRRGRRGTIRHRPAPACSRR